MDPSKSSVESLHREHDYNVNPFAPLGYALKINVMPSKKKTWEAHSKSGYYLGVLWSYYRCHQIWISDSRSMRIEQIVFFKHTHVTQSAVTAADGIVQASNGLCQILKGLSPVKSDPKTAGELLVNF